MSNTAAAGMTRATGGVRLIEAMETAALSVVAEVAQTRSLGGTGHAATLVIETALPSQMNPPGKLEIGEQLQIAWEELSPARAPRFGVGDRILVALGPLPGASIWLARLPDAGQRMRTLTIAMKGDAFLRSPSAASVLVLEHYLSLPSELREGGNGIGYLVQLAASGEVSLASDAVTRLGARSKLAEWVVGAVANNLVAALLRSDATRPLQEALVELIGKRRLTGLRESLTALANGKTPAPPPVYSALGALDGGLSEALTARLMALGPGPYREVVARHAGGRDADRVLRSLLVNDPSPEVRTRAIERLLALGGNDAAEAVATALYDREPRVRGSAAKQLGELGPAAIPLLQRVVDSSDRDAALAAVAGLALIGTSESSAVLLEIAATHPEESIRNVAKLAIGRKMGHD